MSEAEPKQPKKRLTIISLNTQLLPISTEMPGDLTRFVPTFLLDRADDLGRRFLQQTTSQERRADAMADLLIAARPDVICLQEVFDRPGRRRLIARLSPFLPFIAEPNSQALVPGNSGLMTLSRYPFVAVPKCHMWSARAGTDKYAAKGLMVTALDLTDLESGLCALIANVHLQAGDHKAIRAGQLVELRRAIAATLHADVIQPHYDVPRAVDWAGARTAARSSEEGNERCVRSYVTFVGGDFNIEATSKEYKDIADELALERSTRKLFDDGDEDDKKPGGCTEHQLVCDLALHASEPADTHDEGRLDYWFCLGGLVTAGVEVNIAGFELLKTREPLFSDHDGIVARLDLRSQYVLAKPQIEAYVGRPDVQRYLDELVKGAAAGDDSGGSTSEEVEEGRDDIGERERRVAVTRPKPTGIVSPRMSFARFLALDASVSSLVESTGKRRRETLTKAALNPEKSALKREIASIVYDDLSLARGEGGSDAESNTRAEPRPGVSGMLEKIGSGMELLNAVLVGYVDKAVQYFDATEIVLKEPGRPRSRREALDELEHAAKFMDDAHPLRRKAFGRRHAMSDIVDADGNDGLRYDMRWARRVEYLDPEPKTVRFEAGAAFDVLNRALEADRGIERGNRRRFSLKNQPGYDGLTFTGTLSTGGHGSSVSTGALSEHVARIRLGVVPKPKAFEYRHLAWPEAGSSDPGEKRQNLMRGALVGLGLIGLISELEVEIEPATRIAEVRTREKWRSLSRRIDDLLEWATEGPKRPPVPVGVKRPILGTPHSLEIWINPYDTENVVLGKRWRTSAPLSRVRELTLRNSVATFAGQRYLERIKRHERIRRAEIEDIHRFALDSVVNPEPVVMSHADGLSFGAPNFVDTLAIAVAVPVERLVEAIDAISATAIKMAEEDKSSPHGRLLGSPVGVRLVGPFASGRRPFLAPQFEKGGACPSGVTAMIELPTLRDFKGAEEALSRLCRTLMDRVGGRPHWGQYLPITKQDVARLYGDDVCRFVAVRRDLDPQDVFSNSFAERFGLGLRSCAYKTLDPKARCPVCPPTEPDDAA